MYAGNKGKRIMPVCQGCGGSYDDGFKFCPYCGRAKPEPEVIKVLVSVLSQENWEICKIRIAIHNLLSGQNHPYLEYTLSAIALSPNGRYLAGESPLFRFYLTNTPYEKMDYSGRKFAENFLIKQLAKDGWNVNPSSDIDEIQFRRQISERNPKPWKLWWIDPIQRGSRYHFALCRVVGTKQDKNNVNCPDYEYYGESADFKSGFFGSTIGKADDEKTRILNAFIHDMKRDGFEIIESSENETLKKCYKSNTSDLWYLNYFMKREQ
jgi:hypothetical protein